MKNLIYILMIAAVVLTSCKKNTNEVTPQGDNMQEVEFNITSILNSTDRALEIPICNDDLNASYAEFVIDGTTYFTGVYYIGDSLYTKAVMMAPGGPYTVTEFYIWDDGGTPGYDGTPAQVAPPGSGSRIDDQLYKAAPMPDSDFFEFADNQLDIEFYVTEFLKTKIYIDVLCYVPHQYQDFGFFWFNITEITIREMCFFGDICLKSTLDYEGSWYEGQENGLQIDMPAIFKIAVYHQREGHDEVFVGEFSNDAEDWLGEGAPLCFRYADYDADIDHYRFVLWVYVADGDDDSGFGYVEFGTLEFDDMVPDEVVGTDGVVDFVIGNCHHMPGDDVWVLEPYMNLPESGEMKLYSPADPGDITGAYWDVEFAGFGSGYDIKTGEVYPGWCGDKWHTINFGWHDVIFYSTLDDAADMPAPHLTDRKLEQLNYLFNNFKNHNLDLYPLSGVFEPATTQAIQQSIWMVAHAGTTQPYTPGNSLALTMGSDALSSNSLGYLIPPGGDAGVMMFTDNSDRVEYVDQLILIVVDP
ncbi:MAG: hypothetical protein KQH67_04775 [Bacteroidetes bacterium]|nr:hypothetical protein [Bacteroidota bacterium]